MHFKEVQALAKGQALPSMQNNSIKHRVTMAANAGFAPLKSVAQEVMALGEEDEGSYSSESDFDDQEYEMMRRMTDHRMSSQGT